MKKLLTLLLLLAVCGTTQTDAFAAKRDKQRKLNYTITDIGAEDFTYYTDIRYGERPERLRKENDPSDRLLDLYVPKTKAPAGGYPVFFFVHGGGFSGGNKSHAKLGYDRMCRAMAERGYVAVSINYYLTMRHHKVEGVSCGSQMKNGLPEGGKFHPIVHRAMESAASDATLALQWLKEHAKELGINMKDVTVCGGSAGAITVLQLAYFTKQKAAPIKCVVNLWGAVAKPSAIEKPAPPMIIYHGDKDALVHVDYAHAFEARLKELGVRVEKHIMTGKGHAQYGLIVQKYCDEIDAFIKSIQ